MESDELMFWADDAAWFQYRDEYGRVRTSLLGNCDSVEGLRRFCEAQQIPFKAYRQRPVTQVRSSPASSALRLAAPLPVNYE